MSTTLSLEASKKVYKLVGEYETDSQHLEREEADCFCGNHGDPGYISIPAPNFSELIRVLPKIGKKKGWGTDVRSMRSLHMLNLCHLYMMAPTESKGMEAAEKYLMTLL